MIEDPDCEDFASWCKFAVSGWFTGFAPWLDIYLFCSAPTDLASSPPKKNACLPFIQLLLVLELATMQCAVKPSIAAAHELQWYS